MNRKILVISFNGFNSGLVTNETHLSSVIFLSSLEEYRCNYFSVMIFIFKNTINIMYFYNCDHIKTFIVVSLMMLKYVIGESGRICYKVVFTIQIIYYGKQISFLK